jgi:hypothetical protein
MIDAALAYWIPRCKTLAEAQRMARDQVDFGTADDDEWKGPNDAMPLHSY